MQIDREGRQSPFHFIYSILMSPAADSAIYGSKPFHCRLSPFDTSLRYHEVPCATAGAFDGGNKFTKLCHDMQSYFKRKKAR